MFAWLKGTALGIAVAATAIVVIVVVGFMAVFGIGWFQRSTANFRGQTSAIERTKGNAAFRIAAYNEFFDLCSQVQALEDRATIQAQQTGPDVATNVAAIRSSRATLIREYNAKAARSFTEGQFRASSLPYQLTITSEETQCAI